MQSSLWVIDGNNVIRRDPRLATILEDQGFGAACAFLESELGLFRSRRGRGTSVVVAYDGVAEMDAPRRGGRGLRIVQPRPGEDADRLVLEEVRRAEGRMEVHVVSSDRQDITGRLRGLAVQIHGVEEFTAQLRRGAGQGRGAAEAPDPEKPPPPRGAEVDHWLREFEDEIPESREGDT